MVELITAEEARNLEGVGESLNKIHKTINDLIVKAILNDERDVEYILSPYLFRNYDTLAKLLKRELEQAGYIIMVFDPRSASTLKIDRGICKNRNITFKIKWQAASYTEGGETNESEAEE